MLKKPGGTHLSSQKIYQFSSVTQSCLTLCDPMNQKVYGHIYLYHEEINQYNEGGKSIIIRKVETCFLYMI